MTRLASSISLGLLLSAVACGGSGGTPSTYQFTNDNDQSTVAYSGQILRHVLISELANYIEVTLITEVETLGVTANGTEVIDKLNNDYYWFGSADGIDCQPTDFPCQDDAGADGGRSLTAFSLDLPVSQNVFSDIAPVTSTKGGKLKEKIAGFDDVGRDWNTLFVGWNPADATNADELMQHFFGLLQDRAETLAAQTSDPTANGIDVNDPNGDQNTDDAVIYVTAQGQDIKQLVQKFLLGAIAFNQATDDYLDDAQDGKGLLSSHERGSEDPYTDLEHVWDEGFGYFGASRDYPDYPISALAGKCSEDPGCTTGGPTTNYFDTNGDGEIDLESEFNFGASVNAAKRDWGSRENPSPSQIRDQAWQGFIEGRALIASREDTIGDDLDMLKSYRDQAVLSYEKAIAATAIHYINDTLEDMNGWAPASDPTGANFSAEQFLTLAKHWSELKGFALSFQFSPRTPVTNFSDLHALIGDAPVVPGSTVSVQDWNDYKTALLEARDILQSDYGFDTDNVANW